MQPNRFLEAKRNPKSRTICLKPNSYCRPNTCKGTHLKRKGRGGPYQPKGTPLANLTIIKLRYQPPFRTVRPRIAVALVVFIKTPINHIFFKSLIIPDYGFELTKTIYSNVFRNCNALSKRTRLYKSCSTPAGNKRKKTIKNKNQR